MGEEGEGGKEGEVWGRWLARAGRRRVCPACRLGRFLPSFLILTRKKLAGENALFRFRPLRPFEELRAKSITTFP